MVLLPVDGDTLGEDSEPAKGLRADEKSVLVDLKNINKEVVHSIEAPIAATTRLATTFRRVLLVRLKHAQGSQPLLNCYVTNEV